MPGEMEYGRGGNDVSKDGRFTFLDVFVSISCMSLIEAVSAQNFIVSLFYFSQTKIMKKAFSEHLYFAIT